MNPSASPLPNLAAVPGAAGMRKLGHFGLVGLAGRSRQSMVLRVRDLRQPTRAGELIMVMPRAQPADAAQGRDWEERVRRAGRLRHPQLSPALEIGQCERWPFVLYDASGCETLAQRLQREPMPAAEIAAVLVGALEALAFAHDGGVLHGDVQTGMLLLGEQGAVRWIGLEVAEATAPEPAASGPARTSVEALQLHRHREAARQEVLRVGLILHHALAGQPALDEGDLGQAADSLAPVGRSIARLPWNTPRPVPEALRAIANRSTDRQPRQRYRSARALARALDGWLQVDGRSGGGPLALLLDRLPSVGILPAAPGSAARASRLALMDRERTHEMAEVVLQDVALALDLLRWANSAQVRGAQPAGSGAVLTVRRAVAMIGLEGIRRSALGLREWPGPLSEPAALVLGQLLATARRAGRLAQALRPAGYDAEVVQLVTLLQQLGRLVTAYHFPDEWQQIQRLMQPAAAVPADAGPVEPGMGEQAASYAVLGADIEGMGVAVARHWGMDDSVLHLMRRLPLGTMPRQVDNDDEMLRVTASCAIEAMDTLLLEPPRREAALRRVEQRYARVLKLNPNELRDAMSEKTGAQAIRTPESTDGTGRAVSD
jgi:non-specific serine/threonine protein kinase